jgi:GAF domain-containing protein
MLEFDSLTDAFNHMLKQIGRWDQHLRAQMNRLNLLRHTTAAIGDRQDLPSIFQVVLRNVGGDLPIDFGSICLHGAASTTLTVTTLGPASREITASLDLAEHTSVPIDRNGLSRCMCGQLVYEPDIRGIQLPFPQRLPHGGFCSLVIATQSVESNIFGAFISARRAPQAFTSTDCAFLKQLSEYVALAAYQAQL